MLEYVGSLNVVVVVVAVVVVVVSSPPVVGFCSNVVRLLLQLRIRYCCWIR